MSYQRQNFKEGQVLTHDHLNHIEDGILALEGTVTIDPIDFLSLEPIWILGENIDNTGAIKKYSTYARTDYVELPAIEHKQMIYTPHSAEMWCTISEYTEDKNFLIRSAFGDTMEECIAILQPHTKYVIISYGRSSSSNITMTTEDAQMINLVVDDYVPVEPVDARWDIINNSIQINDGLKETCAASNSNAYDKEYGILFCSHNSHGLSAYPSYGESDGRTVLQAFPPEQPWNKREMIIDEGTGANRKVLSPNLLGLGKGKVRIFWNEHHTDNCIKYREYDFVTDKLGDTQKAKMLLNGQEVDITPENAKAYVSSKGFTPPGTSNTIINKFFKAADGTIYTSITLDTNCYGIICKVTNNYLMEPIAICPTITQYELPTVVNGTNIYCLGRKQGEAGIFFQMSKDMGVTWESMKTMTAGIASRPMLDWYRGGLLITYNYKNTSSTENFPPMHNYRNAIKMLWGLEEDPNKNQVILDVFSKYGFVEYSIANVYDEIYFIYSNTRKALSVANNKAWYENGSYVEQGKEQINYAKMGYLF